MIKRLVIHRFRGIHQGVLDDLGKINLLIGPNNSGKTAILEMMYLAGVAGRECEVLIPDVEPSAWKATTLNQLDFLGYRPLSRLRRRHGEPRKWRDTQAERINGYTLDIRIKSDKLPEGYPLRRFTLSAPPDEKGSKGFFEKGEEFYVSLFRLTPHAKVSVPEPMMPPFFNEQRVSLENTYWTYLWEKSWIYQWTKKSPIDHFAVWAIEGKLAPPENVLFFDFHVATQKFKKNFADHTFKVERKITKNLAKVFPEIKGARIYNNTGYISLFEKEDDPIPIDHFGDGARHAFKVLASLTVLLKQASKEKPGLFLWEDPELFMHPATLGRLLEQVIELTRDMPIQLLITTQSLEVLAWFVKMVEDGQVM